MHILVVDDHTIIRRGIRNLLASTYPGARISDTKSIKETSSILEQEPVDLVILDLVLTDGNAFDILPVWLERHTTSSFLVYSMNPEHLYTRRVLAMGCKGYLSKECQEEELITAIDRVRSGGVYMGPRMAALVKQQGADGLEPFRHLSDREVQVMREMLAGTSTKETSSILGISPSSVATYKSRLLDKLGVANEVELRRLAEIHGVMRT